MLQLRSLSPALAAEQRAAAMATIAADAGMLAASAPEHMSVQEALTHLIDRFEAVRANDLIRAQALKAEGRGS